MTFFIAFVLKIDASLIFFDPLNFPMGILETIKWVDLPMNQPDETYECYNLCYIKFSKQIFF